MRLLKERLHVLKNRTQVLSQQLTGAVAAAAPGGERERCVASINCAHALHHKWGGALPMYQYGLSSSVVPYARSMELPVRAPCHSTAIRPQRTKRWHAASSSTPCTALGCGLLVGLCASSSKPAPRTSYRNLQPWHIPSQAADVVRAGAAAGQQIPSTARLIQSWKQAVEPQAGGASG